jgi:hypothetical protein
VAAAADLIGRHLRQAVPAHVVRQFDPHTPFHRLSSAGHHDAWDRTVREVVALFEDLLLLPHHF